MTSGNPCLPSRRNQPESKQNWLINNNLFRHGARAVSFALKPSPPPTLLGSCCSFILYWFTDMQIDKQNPSFLWHRGRLAVLCTLGKKRTLHPQSAVCRPPSPSATPPKGPSQRTRKVIHQSLFSIIIISDQNRFSGCASSLYFCFWTGEVGHFGLFLSRF